MITLGLDQIESFIKVRPTSLGFPSSVDTLTNSFLSDIRSDSNPLWVLHHRHEIVNPLLLQPSLPLSDLLHCVSCHWDSFHPLVDWLDAHRLSPLPAFRLQLGSIYPKRPLRQ